MWNTTPPPPIFGRDFGQVSLKIDRKIEILAIFFILPYNGFVVWIFIFLSKNGFSSQKVQKYWKSKNGVKTALTPLFKDLWAVFSFVKFKNQISPQKSRKSFDDLQIFDRKSSHFLRDFRRILDILLYWCLLKFNFWFFPQNTFSRQKVQKNWKSKNGVKTALTPLFKELWAIFDILKFKNQISPPQKNQKNIEDLQILKIRYPPQKSRKRFEDLQILHRKFGHFWGQKYTCKSINFSNFWMWFWTNFGYLPYYTDCFFTSILDFPPKKQIFKSKSSKKLNVQKWCQNGSNSII